MTARASRSEMKIGIGEVPVSHIPTRSIVHEAIRQRVWKLLAGWIVMGSAEKLLSFPNAAVTWDVSFV